MATKYREFLFDSDHGKRDIVILFSARSPVAMVDLQNHRIDRRRIDTAAHGAPLAYGIPAPVLIAALALRVHERGLDVSEYRAFSAICSKSWA